MKHYKIIAYLISEFEKYNSQPLNVNRSMFNEPVKSTALNL